ncbi:hypothetical protein MKEN_00583800 [Mycena kentingensis (nom. inval.)]|nr:hypothetical protein MKEN_00583800 [Mycena kentingensis (nom. inval.)]
MAEATTLDQHRGPPVITRLSLTASLLEDIGSALHSPALKAISKTLHGISAGADKLGGHSQQIVQLLEDINLCACAITSICSLDAETLDGDISIKTIRKMAQFLRPVQSKKCNKWLRLKFSLMASREASNISFHLDFGALWQSNAS